MQRREQTVVRVLESSGQKDGRAYAVIAVQLSAPPPIVLVDRVQIVDPRQAATVVKGAPVAPGPRNAAQLGPPRKTSGLDLPDGLPATKAQRIDLDPDLVAKWRAEAEVDE